VGQGHRFRERESARVLVVDDDQDLRSVLTMALADEGYNVRFASGGRAALAMMETWQPHAIVLDLMMPDLDGWAFRAMQLAMPAVADVPVVVLSAVRNVQVETLRAAAVLPKPFDLDLLLDTVAGLIR
jgi:CheY-like chemotaxis protein